MASLGRLEPVQLREVWPNEASDFTPWLAENLDVLGQAVGLALELRQREHPVGRYALDLLLEDARGRVVIVENQLEQTDHTHLGQLLTYCAGAKADVVIWIAQSITEEHAAALEWLNDNTVVGVGFFGIELEALRIADSVPAPHFKLVVRPNDWAKSSPRTPGQAASWTWETYASEMQLPQDRIETGRQLVDAIAVAAEERGLPWQPVMNKGYIAIQRPGAYNVLVVDLWYAKVPRLAAKIPGPPETLGLTSPYPSLQEVWTASGNEWGWTVPPGSAIPDVGQLIDLIRPYHPARGPMRAPQRYGPATPAS
jgi:hypothetical protein